MGTGGVIQWAARSRPLNLKTLINLVLTLNPKPQTVRWVPAVLYNGHLAPDVFGRLGLPQPVGGEPDTQLPPPYIAHPTSYTLPTPYLPTLESKPQLVKTKPSLNYKPLSVNQWAVNPAPGTLQGYLAHKKHPPPADHHRSLGVGLL